MFALLTTETVCEFAYDPLKNILVAARTIPISTYFGPFGQRHVRVARKLVLEKWG